MKAAYCTDYTGAFMDSICRHFAKRGFCVIKPEYRRGRLQDKKADKSIQQQASQYCACQDGRGVIRTVFKKERTSAGALYRIDTTKIFLGGASSGGTIPVNIGYYRTQAMNDSAFPTPPGEPTTMQALGPINANYYVGDTNINFRPYIKGVMGMWTGPNIPYSLGSTGHEADFFWQGANNTYNNQPYIGFHGMLDDVFPYLDGSGAQNFQFSKPPGGTNFNYNATTNCLIDGFTGSYHLDTVNNKRSNTADLIQGSSLNMYNILNSLYKLTELYVDSTMGHGVDDGDDFGIGDDLTTPKEDIWLYMVQRGATFFRQRAIM